VRKRANKGRGRQQAGSRHVCHEEQQDIPATRQKRLLRSIIHDFNRQRPLSLTFVSCVIWPTLTNFGQEGDLFRDVFASPKEGDPLPIRISRNRPDIVDRNDKILIFAN
jgi:hypothetical protein